MRFSRAVKSSAHSIPSPDGANIATVLPSKLILRSTRSLEATRVISLPDTFSNSPGWFLWSPSADKVLIASNDVIRVYSVSNARFSAIISNPTAGTAKISYIAFGASDTEVLVISDFGLKLTVFKLALGTSIEINAPKIFATGLAAKGFSYRPGSLHFALLTRYGGKDVISIHSRDTYEVVRSWHPDTIDAQSLSWGPDGRWLTVVESAGQGHKVLLYTGDGHLFKTWRGPARDSDDSKNIDLGAGVKILEWNATSTFIALGDHSPSIEVLTAPQFSSMLNLNHSTTVMPGDGLKVKSPQGPLEINANRGQIWQEQLTPSSIAGFDRAYVLSTQPTAPPTTVASTTSEVASKNGIQSLSIDASGTLLASRMENMPTTVFIWDLATRILKSVLVQHAPVLRATWHPYINELLMIRCEGDESRGLAHTWEPTWDMPKIIDFGTQVPEGKLIGKTVIRWLSCPSQIPAVFFSDTQDCMLAAILDDEEADLPWQDAVVQAVDNYGEREESPLNLEPASGTKNSQTVTLENPLGEDSSWDMDDGSQMDDTFHFKKPV